MWDDLLKDKLRRLEDSKDTGQPWWLLLDDLIKILQDEDLLRLQAELKKKTDRRAAEAARKGVELVQEAVKKKVSPAELLQEVENAIKDYHQACYLAALDAYEQLRLKLLETVRGR